MSSAVCKKVARDGMRKGSVRVSKKVAYCAVLIALAMILSYVEVLIPVHIGIPGIKLGLANLVVVAGFALFSPLEVFLISLGRIVLTGLLFGSGLSMLYSLAGGLLSYIVMLLLYRLSNRKKKTLRQKEKPVAKQQAERACQAETVQQTDEAPLAEGARRAEMVQQTDEAQQAESAQTGKGFSLIGVSIAGGAAHNIGQLLVAAVVVENLKIFVYLPVLLAAGTLTGMLIGIVSSKIVPILRKM